MKARIIFHSLLAALALPAAGMLTACDDAEADAIANSVYILEATSSKASKVAVEEDGAKVTFTVRMAEPLTQDVTATVKVDPSILTEYNALNSTNYEALPEEYYQFLSTEAVIKAGEVLAPQTEIQVSSFTTGGKNFALPVVVDQVDGPIGKTITSSKFIFILDKPLIVKTPRLQGSYGQGVKCAPAEKWGIISAAWTLEGWVRMADLRSNNRALFTSGSSDHEIYIRFGDVSRPGKYPDYMPYLQIKTLGSQVETGPVFERNKWAHFALTYDGTYCTIYVNGNQEAQFAPPAPKGGAVRFDQMTMIGSGSYFNCECNLSQVRMWKIALSQTQIQNNMFYELDASNPDMMAYWKMDEGEGTFFADATGNGHDGTTDNTLRGWTDFQRFDK